MLKRRRKKSTLRFSLITVTLPCFRCRMCVRLIDIRLLLFCPTAHCSWQKCCVFIVIRWRDVVAIDLLTNTNNAELTQCVCMVVTQCEQHLGIHYGLLSVRRSVAYCPCFQLTVSFAFVKYLSYVACSFVYSSRTFSSCIVLPVCRRILCNCQPARPCPTYTV